MNRGKSATIEDLPLWHRFHVRITLVYAIAVLVVIGLLSSFFYRVSLGSEVDGLKERLLATAISLAVTLDGDALNLIDGLDDVTSPTYQRVMAQFETICRRYRSITSIYVMFPTNEPNMLRIAVDYTRSEGNGQSIPGEIYDASSLPVMLQGLEAPSVEQEPFRDEYGLTLSGYAPLLDSVGQPIGLVGVDLDAARLDEIRRQVGLLTGAVFGVAALVLAALGFLVGRSMRRPLSTVMFASKEVSRGNLKARVELKRNDEFGLLGDNFNYMAKGLEERDFIRDTFGRYVSRDVVTTLLDNPGAISLGGEERTVTVLISDIRQYSTIAEELSPTQVVSLINAYLGAMNEVIDKHRGCVIEYLGDGILAVFGAPNNLPDHASSAVRCALAMQQRLAELNAEWDASGLSDLWRHKGVDRLSTRIGIHTGTVVAGNLGSPSRMKYAVAGDAVNIAARLEALNKDLQSEILVSLETWSALSPDLKTAGIDRGEHQVKGRGHAIHVFSL